MILEHMPEQRREMTVEPSAIVADGECGGCKGEEEGDDTLVLLPRSRRAAMFEIPLASGAQLSPTVSENHDLTDSMLHFLECRNTFPNSMSTEDRAMVSWMVGASAEGIGEGRSTAAAR